MDFLTRFPEQEKWTNLHYFFPDPKPVFLKALQDSTEGEDLFFSKAFSFPFRWDKQHAPISFFAQKPTGSLKEAGDFVVLEHGQDVQGRTLPADTKVYFDPQGRVLKIILPVHYGIEDVICKAGTIVGFYPNGKLRVATAAIEQSIQGKNIPAGETVVFDQEGKLNFDGSFDRIHIREKDFSRKQVSDKSLRVGTLSRDQKIAGTEFAEGTIVEIDDSGKLVAVQLSRSHVIQGISFPGNSGRGSNTRVVFGENGKVLRAYLSREAEIQGILCEKKETVYFFENGKLSKATVHDFQSVQGIRVDKKATVLFYENGKLKSAKLSKPRMLVGTSEPETQTIDGVECKGGSKVTFHENGKLDTCFGMAWYRGKKPKELSFSTCGLAHFDSSASLYSNGSLRYIDICGGNFRGFPIQKTITFHENGKVASVRLSFPQTFQGVRCAAGIVEFYDNGKVKELTLDAAQKVQGIFWSRGENLTFHKNGKVKSGKTAVAQLVSGEMIEEKTSIELDEKGFLVK